MAYCFGDGTKLYASSKPLDELYININNNLDCLFDWPRLIYCHKLLPKPITRFFPFMNNHAHNGFSVCIDTNKVQRKDVVKFWRIHTDNKLTLNEQIKHVNLYISKVRYILRTVKPIIYCHNLKILEGTLPQPHKLYGITQVGYTYQSCTSCKKVLHLFWF